MDGAEREADGDGGRDPRSVEERGGRDHRRCRWSVLALLVRPLRVHVDGASTLLR